MEDNPFRAAIPRGAVGNPFRDALKAPVDKSPSTPQVVRDAEFVAGGISDSLVETLGFIPDYLSEGLALAGLNTPTGGYYTKKLKEGWRKLGETISTPVYDIAGIEQVRGEPQTARDRLAYGVGRGVGDAASFFVPGAAVAKTAKAGGTAARVGAELARQKGMQMTAGAVGGAVGEATDNPYIGAAAALATPYAVGGAQRVVTPVRNQLTREQRRLAKMAASEGIDMTPAQTTGSRPLQYLESVFGDLPFTSSKQQGTWQQQRTQLNRAVLAKAGINADDAAPDVIDDAFRRAGKEFDRLAAQTEISADPRLIRDMEKTARQYARRLPTDIKPVVESYADDFASMRNAMRDSRTKRVVIDGPTYQRIASDLRRSVRGASNNPELQRALNGMVESFDDAVERSMSRGVRESWRDARRRYRNLLIIDDALKGGTQADREMGNVPLSGLRSAVRKFDPRGYSRGRGDLNDLSRVGDMIGAARPPNSGTATRSMLTNAMTLGGAPAFFIDPITTSAVVGSGLLGPRAVQSAYRSRPAQAWLNNQLLPPARPNGGLLGIIGAGRAKDAALAQ